MSVCRKLPKEKIQVVRYFFSGIFLRKRLYSCYVLHVTCTLRKELLHYMVPKYSYFSPMFLTPSYVCLGTEYLGDRVDPNERS